MKDSAIRKVLVSENVPAMPTTTMVSSVTFKVFDPERPIPKEDLDAAGLVLWDLSTTQIRAAIDLLPSLSWIQFLSAGLPSDIAQWGLPAGAIVCSGSSLHDATVAEHAMALTLAAARSLPTLLHAQDKRIWRSDLGGPQLDPHPSRFTTLNNARVVIWGYGSIGRTLGKHYQSFGAKVTGVARTARHQEGIEVKTPAELPTLLPQTDLLVMILPDDPTTTGALDKSHLELLPQHAWVVNVGRGSTVNEEDLVHALRSGRIGGAALDVFEEEPLPENSDLWTLPNVIITPHAAGGRPRGAWDLISKNAAAWVQGERLLNQWSTSAG